MDFERILLVITGIAIALLSDWCLTFWRSSENRRSQEEARKILTEHGLSAHLYMPGFGVNDPVLHGALDRLAFSGRVVIDQNGYMVGRLMPKVGKGSHLRLVVNNSN